MSGCVVVTGNSFGDDVVAGVSFVMFLPCRDAAAAAVDVDVDVVDDCGELGEN